MESISLFTLHHTVTGLFSACLDILLFINQQNITKAIQSDAIITRKQKYLHCVLYLRFQDKIACIKFCTKFKKMGTYEIIKTAFQAQAISFT